MYIIEIHAEDSIVSVKVPENTTVDIAGNKNLQSDILQVKHCKSCFRLSKNLLFYQSELHMNSLMMPPS